MQLAMTLDQLGTVLRTLGHPAEALVQHERAHALLQQAVQQEMSPAEHPVIAANALYMEAARMEAHNGAGRDRVVQQAERYKQLFPSQSIWRQIVDRYLSPACAQARQQPDCLLLL